MSWSSDKFYRTQPPQQIGKSKSDSVLEYLVFSGHPIYVSLLGDENSSRRLTGSMTGIDVLDEEFVLENSGLPKDLKVGSLLKLAFGYKRKRASCESKVLSITPTELRITKPESIHLSNLRRNPRLVVESTRKDHPIGTQMQVKTGTGLLDIQKVEVFECSQLGMSLFISKDEGVVLPGDKIEGLTITQSGKILLQTEGVISRVDMKRSSPRIANSYHIVILFKDREQDENSGPSRRLAKRTPVLDSKPCFLSAEHPFFPGRKIEGQVFEISSSGLSAMLEKTSFPIRPGMRFYNCLLQLPFCAPRELVFEVVHVQFKSDGETNHFKIGGEFVNAPVELLKDIANYSNQVESSFVRDVNQEDLDLLWEFMFETNFIYQSKRRQVQSKSKEILETYHRLMSQENPLVKKIVYEEDSEIKGHLSGLRFFDHAWIIQHLNATKTGGGSAAQSVLQNMTAFLADSKAHQKNEIYYVVSFYRPNNIYPAVLFGESRRILNDPDKCDSFDFVFGLYDEEIQCLKSDEIYITKDEDGDYHDMLNLLLDNKMNSFIRAYGLGTPKPAQLKVSSEYQKLGLKRERHLIRCQQNDISAYALIELSSSGLNLSEITNSIYLFVEDAPPAIQQNLSSLAIQEAYENFFLPLEIHPTVMALPSMAQARNVAWSKVYTCWILAERAMKEFETASNEIFSNFRKYLSLFKETQKKQDSEQAGEPDGKSGKAISIS